MKLLWTIRDINKNTYLPLGHYLQQRQSRESNGKSIKSIHNNAWVSKIRMDTNLVVAHIHKYIRLWVHLNVIHIYEDIKDSISLNLTPMGVLYDDIHKQCTILWRYSHIDEKVGLEGCGHPWLNFFTWLAIRNRLWMEDPLEKRWWNNCGRSPLRKKLKRRPLNFSPPKRVPKCHP
jgi:hypothetical protein